MNDSTFNLNIFFIIQFSNLVRNDKKSGSCFLRNDNGRINVSIEGLTLFEKNILEPTMEAGCLIKFLSVNEPFL